MIRIITDSAADFEPWELSAMNITCINLNVSFGEQEYQENTTLSKDRFYALLAQTGEFPKTSQASPQTLLDMLQDAKAAGDSAIYITLASALSGTYQNAVMAKNMLEYDNCYIIDSCNATGGQRMLVEYAVKLRDQGIPAARITAEAKALRSRIALYACMDTLEYLYRGGRISHTVYKIGSLAQIKPILHVTSAGSLEVPAKAMGMRKGMDFLCKRLEQQKPDPHFPLYVMYTGNRTNGELLAQRFATMGFEIPESRIINVGAAIGSHIGPNACGMVYVAE